VSIYYSIRYGMTILWGLFLVGSLNAAGETTPKKEKQDKFGTWMDVALEKRCEGLLKFLNDASKIELPDWIVTNPQCVIAGGSQGDVSWTIDASWQKGSKALPLRFSVIETSQQKAKTIWCVVKGKVAGCASPWETTFSQGKMFTKAKDAKDAYNNILKISQGFLSLASKLDEWVGRRGESIRFFDVTYNEWIRAWVQSPRSLPVKEGILIGEYAPDGDSATTGVVKFKGELPVSIRECLGCPTTVCERAPVTFSFSGLSLTLTRVLQPEEQKALNAKSASMSWIMMEPTPFISGVPKWPFMCGEHRFNVQKI
jgi:hypothetical protein